MSTHRPTHPAAPDRTGRSPRGWRRAAVAGTAVLALGALGAGPALANDAPDSKNPPAVEGQRGWLDHGRHAGGIVAAVDGTNLVLTRRDGSQLNVTTSDATTTVTSTASATLADIAPGSFVSLRVRKADDGSLTAKGIHIRPAPETNGTDGTDGTAEVASWGGWKRWRGGVAGTVESFDATTGTLTVSTPDGPVTVQTTEDTKVAETVEITVADVAVGAVVKLKGAFEADGTFAATRVHVLAAVQPPVTTDHPPTTEAPVTEVPPTTEAPPPTGDDGSEDGSPSNSRYHGTVLAVNDATFSLALPDGTVVSVVTTEDTEFWSPSRHGEKGNAPLALADVTVGAWVKVKGSLAGNVLTADKVVIGPQQAGGHGGGRSWDRHDGHKGDKSGKGDSSWGDDAESTWDGRDGRNRDRSGEGSERDGYWTPSERPSHAKGGGRR